METPKHNYDDETIARFWAKVDRSKGPEACWAWRACLNSGGYGGFAAKGKTFGSHVFSFIISNLNYDPELDVMHSCSFRKCVNPKHLSQGTHSENILDAARKGRMYSPAKLTVEQVAEIRAIMDMTVDEIAVKYGLSVSHVYDIRSRKYWKNVP
jgi:hypothetical protein